MSDSPQFTERGTLALVGLKFQQWGIGSIVGQHVTIKQKTLRHTPLEKLLDCLMNILAGGHGLVEINTRVREDEVLQRAFGRARCAEQSTISDTLNACTAENVQQLRTALIEVLRQHSQAYHHNYAHYQLLDIDMTGLCAGRQGEGVTKGYFAQRKNARGRQLGRVVASRYDEILTERLFDGKRQLETSLLELVEVAAQTLELDENKRKNTVLRIDGGGGSDHNIDALLNQDYQLLVKVHNWQRARKLAETVTEWFADPKTPEREVGWVSQPHAYVRATQQIAIRKRQAKDTAGWSYAVIVSRVSEAVLCEMTHRTQRPATDPERALQIVYAYDLRGGGAETQNRNDKQGLGLAKRNKRKFAAQEMLILLGQLAHNLVIWTRNALAQETPSLRKYGIQRMVRDVLQIPGMIQRDAVGKVQITLRENHPLAPKVLGGFRKWLPRDDLSLNLGKI